MRAILDLDDDILQAAKELARIRKSTAGKVLSELARRGLDTRRPAKFRNGVLILRSRPVGAVRPTMKRVNNLRD